MTRFTDADHQRAAELRASFVCWKKIEREIGEGIRGSYHSIIYRERHAERIAEKRRTAAAHLPRRPKTGKTPMRCTISVYSHKYEGNVGVSDRRAHVMCNAWFGLSLWAGLEKTPTDRAITCATIRFLRAKGLLYDDAVTDMGRVFLAQIRLKNGKRGAGVYDHET